MKLYGNCISCKKEISIKSLAKNRGDLQMQKGNEFKINCNHCGKIFNIHVNKVRAKIDKRLIYLGVALSALLFIMIFSFSYRTVISTAIPIIFWYQEMSAVKSFNNYMIRRK